MPLPADRRVPYDWFDGPIPLSVDVDDEAYVESGFSFVDCRSNQPHAIQIARGAHVYSSTIFDVGPSGTVIVGPCAMLNGARIVCDQRVEIGAFATISWNVMFIDSYRVPSDPLLRQKSIVRAAQTPGWVLSEDQGGRPIVLHANVWIGFDVCVLPGVTIGEGAVIGARSVVTCDVPAYTVVAGNPARVIRELPRNVSIAEELRSL